jgi:hypothetical protein
MFPRLCSIRVHIPDACNVSHILCFVSFYQIACDVTNIRKQIGLFCIMLD